MLVMNRIGEGGPHANIRSDKMNVMQVEVDKDFVEQVSLCLWRHIAAVAFGSAEAWKINCYDVEIGSEGFP